MKNGEWKMKNVLCKSALECWIDERKREVNKALVALL